MDIGIHPKLYVKVTSNEMDKAIIISTKGWLIFHRFFCTQLNLNFGNLEFCKNFLSLEGKNLEFSKNSLSLGLILLVGGSKSSSGL